MNLSVLFQFLRRHFPRIVAILFWLSAILAIHLTLQHNHLTLVQLAAKLEVVMATHWYGPVLFFVIFIFRPFTLIPAIILVALGGRIFGLEVGFIVGLFAKTASAIIPYYGGRLFAGELDAGEVHGKIRRLSQRIARFLRRNAFEALVAMRLVHVPYDVVSFVAGNLYMPFRVFIGGTFVGNIAGVYGFTALGASLHGDVISGKLHVDLPLVISSLAVFTASIIASCLLRRHVNETAASV